MNPPTDYLRLRTRPRPETPPQGCVDLTYDAASGSLVSRDASGTATTIGGQTPEALWSLLGSFGGNGEADYGKLAAFGTSGGLLLGSTTAAAPTQGMLYVVCGTGTAIGAANLQTGGVVFEAGMGGTGVIGYSVHLGPQAGQVGLGIDGSGGVASGIGYFSYMPGLAMVCADADFKETISVSAGNTDAAGGWVAWSTSGDRGGNEIRLKGQTPTALQVITLPDQTGYLPVVPGYADLTAANAALSSGDFFWDTTLKKLRTATA
jgi:hypothetical protein